MVLESVGVTRKDDIDRLTFELEDDTRRRCKFKRRFQKKDRTSEGSEVR